MWLESFTRQTLPSSVSRFGPAKSLRQGKGYLPFFLADFFFELFFLVFFLAISVLLELQTER